MKFDIKVGPPPALKKRRFACAIATAEIVAQAKLMPKDSWFLVPGTQEMKPGSMATRRRAIQAALEDARLDECQALILDDSEGSGIIVRRQPEFMESGKTARLRAQKLGGA